ncbi:MAG: transglycosylase SLT domain-containing protein [Micropepsaceae bacterium]
MIEKAGASVATVAFAIERASARTGVDFDYLMKTAARESSLNPDAKAGTSSAAGLFQFIDQTWLGMIKEHGAEHGLSQYADQITQTRGGRYVVADRQICREILALRYDPEISATMAGEFTQDSADALRGSLGREPTGGELYAAHFLGAGGALDLIKAAKAGEGSAASIFPDAARANRSIFYAKGGGARSASDVLAVLDAKHRNADLPDAPAIAEGQMMAKLRGTDATMDDIVVGPEYAQVLTGRAALDDASFDDGKAAYTFDSAYDTAGFGLGYKPGVAQGVVTPFVAQLLASLDPIPDKARDTLLKADRAMRREGEFAA